MSGPLEGIRVIDVGTRISAPFCAGLLGELGADVIKVELPGQGDFMRTMGPFIAVDGGPDYSLSWSVEGRGRRGVTCDLRHPEGKDLFKQLADRAVVALNTVIRLEQGVVDPGSSTLDAIRRDRVLVAPRGQ